MIRYSTGSILVLRHYTRMKHFRAWLKSPLGQSLVVEEKKIIQKKVLRIFGFHLAFLGPSPFLECVEQSPILFRVWLDTHAKKRKDCVSVLARHDKLPILPDDIDLMFLAHCLEFSKNPHEVLREAYSALKPEGQIIISVFNPWSVWGFWRFFIRYINRAPYDGQTISIKRLRDWLALLGFDVIQVSTCFFLPPIQNKNIMAKLSWFEKTMRFMFPKMGASYIILAKKRILTLTAVRPKFAKHKRLLPAGWAEPVTRN